MGDFNLLNIFFDADNFLLKSNENDFSFKEIHGTEEEPAEWFTEDTLNQMLPLLDQFFCNSDDNIRNFALDECSFDEKLFQTQYSALSKNSNSNEELTANAKFVHNILPTDASSLSTSALQKDECGTKFSSSDENFFDAVEYVQEEIIEYEEICISSSSESDKSASSDDSCDVDEFYYIGRNEIVSDYTTEKVKIVYPKHRHECLESVISSPSKKIKFSKKLDSKISSGKKKQCTNDVKSSQPRLQLTSEEKKIALIEGIELPTHYPLTKEQERQLKRIRRKIRNKISAQNSRRRKQEYVDSLEQKLKRTSEENARLMKRIKSLESEKSTLTTKVSQLQAAVARGSGQTVQPTSCLLVLIMSLALILAPSLKNSSLMDENFNDKDTSMFDGQSSALLNSVRSSSRNLLFSPNSSEKQNDFKEEFKMITNLLQKIRFSNSNVLSEFLEILRMKSNEKYSAWKNRNNFKSRNLENFEINGNDPRAPLKMMRTFVSLPSKFDSLKNKTVDIKLQKPITINNRHMG